MGSRKRLAFCIREALELRVSPSCKWCGTVGDWIGRARRFAVSCVSEDEICPEGKKNIYALPQARGEREKKRICVRKVSTAHL